MGGRYKLPSAFLTVIKIMKKKKGFSLQRLINEYVVVGSGREAYNFNKVIRLNETSAFLWEAMGEKEFTSQQLTEALCAEYDVDAATASKAVIATIEKLRGAGVLED